MSAHVDPRALHRDGTPAGAVGRVAALATAVVGIRGLARRPGSDTPGAVAHDVVAPVPVWFGRRRR